MLYKSYSSYPDSVEITIEMHQSMWCDDFHNYSVRDLFGDGKLYNDPDLLDAPEKIKNKVRRGFYNTHPVPARKLREKAVSGYVYVVDDEDGRMMIYHFEPPKEPTFE